MSYSVAAAGQPLCTIPQIATVTAPVSATAAATPAAANAAGHKAWVVPPSGENCSASAREVSTENTARLLIQRKQEAHGRLTPPPSSARTGCNSVVRGIRQQQAASYLPPTRSPPFPGMMQPSIHPTFDQSESFVPPAPRGPAVTVQAAPLTESAKSQATPVVEANVSYIPSARAHAQSAELGSSYTQPTNDRARRSTITRIRRATEQTPSYTPVTFQQSPAQSARQSAQSVPVARGLDGTGAETPGPYAAPPGGQYQVPLGLSLAVEAAPDKFESINIKARQDELVKQLQDWQQQRKQRQEGRSLENTAEDTRQARVVNVLPVWSKDGPEVDSHVMHRTTTQQSLSYIPSESTDSSRQCLSYLPTQTSRQSLSPKPQHTAEAMRVAPRRSLPETSPAREGAVMASKRQLLCQRSEGLLLRYQAALESLNCESFRGSHPRAASVEPAVRMVGGAPAAATTVGASTGLAAVLAPQTSRPSSVMRTTHATERTSDNGVVKEHGRRMTCPVQLPAGAIEKREVSVKQAGSNLTIEELIFDGDRFDATTSSVRQQILTKMCLPENSTIELMTQQGGLNQGLWRLTTSNETFILKLVTCQRMHPRMPTEAEQFVKLSREHPSLISDASLSFPVKIFRCSGKNAEACHDLVVMRQAPGQIFSDVISRKLQSSKTAELLKDIGSLGAFLADIHARHGMEHGDFTPSNVFYDEGKDAFTLVDVSDFGPQEWNRRQTDADRFVKGLELMTRCHAPHLFSECKRHFESGYKRRSIAGH